MEHFFHNDRGFVGWLIAHPDGYVLNTEARVSESYLVLHRARCRTINRELPPGRTWTDLYAKICDDDREVIEEWALARTGAHLQPCGICLPGGRSMPIPVGAGSAALTGALTTSDPKGIEFRVALDGEPVRVRVDPDQHHAAHQPPLIIDGAQWLAETFFRFDLSAVALSSYDAWIRDTQASPDRLHRVLHQDVTAVNQTMAARSSHAAWEPVIGLGDVPWLRSISSDWDIFDLSDEDWVANGVSDQLGAAFAAIIRPQLKLAVITKVLHIKRPRLIPVLDSVVMQQIGVPATDDVATWVRAVEQVRLVGRSNRDALAAISSHLSELGFERRPALRVLDALLWAASPGSSLFRRMSQWERVIRPKRD